MAFSDLLKAIIDNNYMQSGADLDTFKEVAPGVIMPSLALPGAKVKESSAAVVKLEEIFAALQRIKDKTYGVCMMTGKQIPKARLQAAYDFFDFTVWNCLQWHVPVPI